MMQAPPLPPFANGHQLCEKELLSCRQLAQALPKVAHGCKQAQSGSKLSHFKGRGMEFAEVRQYQYGDDVRSIDWRVTARTGKAHTKIFQEERERPVFVVADMGFQSRIGSKLMFQSSQIGHVCATLAWHSILQGDRIGCMTTSEAGHTEARPKARRAGLTQLIHLLLQTDALTLDQTSSPQENHLLKTLERLHRLAKPGTSVWLVTDGQLFDEACLVKIRQIKKYLDINLVLVSDPLRRGELVFHRDMCLPIFDGQKQQVLEYQGYQVWLQKQKQQLAFVNQAGLALRKPIRNICSGLPLAQQLMELR
jgi:uncharacterized protein (DUF58 family)